MSDPQAEVFGALLSVLLRHKGDGVVVEEEADGSIKHVEPAAGETSGMEAAEEPPPSLLALPTELLQHILRQLQRDPSRLKTRSRVSPRRDEVRYSGGGWYAVLGTAAVCHTLKRAAQDLAAAEPGDGALIAVDHSHGEVDEAGRYSYTISAVFPRGARQSASEVLDGIGPRLSPKLFAALMAKLESAEGGSEEPPRPQRGIRGSLEAVVRAVDTPDPSYADDHEVGFEARRLAAHGAVREEASLWLLYTGLRAVALHHRVMEWQPDGMDSFLDGYDFERDEGFAFLLAGDARRGYWIAQAHGGAKLDADLDAIMGLGGMGI